MYNQMQTAKEVIKTNEIFVCSSCCKNPSSEILPSLCLLYAALNQQQELHLVPAPVESMSI